MVILVHISRVQRKYVSHIYPLLGFIVCNIYSEDHLVFVHRPSSTGALDLLHHVCPWGGVTETVVFYIEHSYLALWSGIKEGHRVQYTLA